MNIVESPDSFLPVESTAASFTALSGVPLVRDGDDLTRIVTDALAASCQSLRDGDVLVIAQKIVSKAEGRMVRLADVRPSPRALALAGEVEKDPRIVELILRESTEIVRHRPGVLVVAHRLGFVMANAGIDQSNVEHVNDQETALLLPEDPDRTCAALRSALKQSTGADVAVIISDSHGRAFRNGTVGVAIGVSGLAGVADLRGKPDLFGRRLQSTEVGLADEIASAASLLMGQADEGRPIVLARGIPGPRREGAGSELVRAKTIDLFRLPPSAEGTSSVDAAAADRLLRGRRSIRRYAPTPVPDAVIDRILNLTIAAPSAHNRQPWRFAVLKKPADRLRLAEAMAERLRSDRSRDGDPKDAIEQDASRSIARIAGAPLAILVCLTMEEMDVYADGRRSAAEHQMAVQGTAMAMQNLLLAAHAAGLGASVMCAPLFCQDTVRSALRLPQAWEPQALLTLGYPAAPGKPFQRKKLADVVRVL